MPKILAWSVEKQTFMHQPALHMPVGLACVTQLRERVTQMYALLDAGARNGQERTNLISYPLSLRVAGGGPFHLSDDYDEMPPHTERGHLLADVFGGEDHECNLVPMPRAFNQQTWKNEVELTLKAIGLQHAGSMLGMKIDCEYAGQDPRIPSRYAVHLYSFGKKDALREMVGWENVLARPNALFGDIPRGYQDRIGRLFNPFNYAHILTRTLSPGLPGPVLPDHGSVVGTLTLASLCELAEALRGPMLEAHRAMLHANWTLEDTGEALRHTFQLPPAHRRPYAVLDYMLESGELQRLHPRLEKKTLGRCFQSKGFSDWQRELIFAANLILHGNRPLIISDHEDDEVYRQVVADYASPSGELATMGRYEYAVREWVRAVNLAPGLKVPRGALFLNSTAFAPQVDHVIAKAGVGNGIDAFSNAQVVSGRWNRSKSDNAIEQGAVARTRMLFSR